MASGKVIHNFHIGGLPKAAKTNPGQRQRRGGNLVSRRPWLLRAVALDWNFELPYTSQIFTASASDFSGSLLLGMNSWATQPSYLVSTMARMMAG